MVNDNLNIVVSFVDENDSPLVSTNVRNDVTSNLWDIDDELELLYDHHNFDKERESTTESRGPSARVQKNHHVDEVIENLDEGIQIRRKD